MKKIISVLILLVVAVAVALGVYTYTKSTKENEEAEVVTEPIMDEPGNADTAENEGFEAAATEATVTWDDFYNGKVPAHYTDGTEAFYYPDLYIMSQDDPNYDIEAYYLGEMLDYDNDGEEELFIGGMFDSMIIDITDGAVSILDMGDGTVNVLSYVYYDAAYWIVHSDLTHAGRQMRHFDKYSGVGNIVDSFDLNAEYWDDEDDLYDENSDFTYRGEKISMEEYEALLKEIFG